MASELETIYKNKKIIYESFKPELGIYNITVSWWQETPEDYDNYNKFRYRVLHSKWSGSNSIFYPLVLITAQAETGKQAIYTRKRKGMQRFYTDFQITLRLKTVEIEHVYGRYNVENIKKTATRTFKKNLPPVQREIEKFIDILFDCDYAPITYLSKKGLATITGQ